MSNLAFVMQAIFFFVVCACMLSAIGLGVGLYALPKLSGEELLLLPAIGLAVAALTMTWLTPLLPIAGSAAILLLWTAPAAGVMCYRRRYYLVQALHCKWKLLGSTTILALTIYLALLIPVFHSGFFTVASPGTDGIYIYAPVSHYIQTHAYPQPHNNTADNPALVYLRSYYPSEPSALLVPAMTASITGWPAYSVVDAFNALCIGLSVFGLVVLVRSALQVPRSVLLCFTLIYATNQYLVWNMGFDFLPQSQAMMLFATILTLCVISVRDLSWRTGVLLGICAVAVAGIYFPLTVACAACCVGLTAIDALHLIESGHVKKLVSLGMVGAVSAVLFGGPIVYWLVSQGGIAAWQHWSSIKHQGAGPPQFYPVSYLLGVLPVSDFYHWQASWLFGQGVEAWVNRYVGRAYLVVLASGMLTLALTRRRQLLLAVVACVYVAYFRFGSHYVYGFMKAADYMLPITCIVAAWGAYGLIRAGVRLAELGRDGRRLRIALGVGLTTGGLAAIAAILGGQIAASAESSRMFERSAPSVPRAYLSLEALGQIVPKGARVAFYKAPGLQAADWLLDRKYAFGAYVLSEQSVLISHYPFSTDPFDSGTWTLQALQRFDYLLVPSAPDPGLPSGAQVVWEDESLQLELVRLGRLSAPSP